MEEPRPTPLPIVVASLVALAYAAFCCAPLFGYLVPDPVAPAACSVLRFVGVAVLLRCIWLAALALVAAWRPRRWVRGEIVRVDPDALYVRFDEEVRIEQPALPREVGQEVWLEGEVLPSIAATDFRTPARDAALAPGSRLHAARPSVQRRPLWEVVFGAALAAILGLLSVHGRSVPASIGTVQLGRGGTGRATAHVGFYAESSLPRKHAVYGEVTLPTSWREGDPTVQVVYDPRWVSAFAVDDGSGRIPARDVTLRLSFALALLWLWRMGFPGRAPNKGVVAGWMLILLGAVPI